ncbi:hypothetical protein ACROYT_G032349 [Oculina patagonica]
MAVTRSGPTGLSVVGLVAAELKIVIVHAQIQDPHTEDGGVADLDQLRNHGHVTYLDVQWGRWSACSKSCDEGIKYRHRSCTNPPPANGGRYCRRLGRSLNSQICNQHKCPVHGGYSQWSSWSQCSQSCGGGMQHRNRSCTNPPPANGGRDCSRLGRATELRKCNTFGCPVDGLYSQWGRWSACSKSCDGGIKYRYRSCTNPPPVNGGRDCWRLGPPGDSHSCNRHKCLVHGGYSQWSSWSQCSRSCDGGTQTRTRSCTNPPPAYGGKDCTRLEGAKESRECNSFGCPAILPNKTCENIESDDKCLTWQSQCYNNGYVRRKCAKTCRTCQVIQREVCGNIAGDEACANHKIACTSEEAQHICAKTCGKCKVDGRYTQWSRWSACSRSCDGGIKYRSRSCTNPPPTNGGRDCWRLGTPVESQTCNTHKCPVFVNSNVSSQFMVVTRAGAAGHGAVGHAQEELSVAPVHAPIPFLQMEEETVADKEKIQNLENVITTTAQKEGLSTTLQVTSQVVE